MPLPGINSGKIQRCRAKCKSTSEQCKNPSAWGCKTCRYHGARRPSSIKRGANHPQYRHGQETLEVKAERSRRLTELYELEALSFKLGLASGSRWRGRKPKSSLKKHLDD